MIIILRGVSGSGKSTLALELIEQFESLFPKYEANSVSADYFFYKHPKHKYYNIGDPRFYQGEGWEYKFDPTQIGEAHQACYRSFLGLVQHSSNDDLIIVDNTNTQQWEFSPYKLAGEVFGHSIHSICVQTISLEVCVDRNVHGVSEKAIIMQHQRYEDPLYGMSHIIYDSSQSLEEFVNRFLHSLK